MKIKGFICFVLILCFAVLAFAACGKDDNTQASSEGIDSSAESTVENTSDEDSAAESNSSANESNETSDESNEASDESNEESSNGSDESSDEGHGETDAVEETVTVNRADKEFQIEGAVHFVDEKSMNTDWHLKITISEPVSKFNFFAVNGDYEPGSHDVPVNPAIVDEILFSYGKIAADSPILIDTYINDAVANRGISYVNEKGETKYFLLNCNMTGIGPDVYAVRFFIEE